MTIDFRVEVMNRYKKNLIGFWLLGLFNNYSFVIMLSAAHDLIHDNENTNTNVTDVSSSNNTRDCNELSTGTILLADEIPAIIIKLFAPFIALWISARVSVVVIFSCLSFIIVSFSRSNPVTLLGVVCASLSSGLGEVSFLAFTHQFSEPVISAWASGTGAAGVIGAGSYALLTSLGLSPQQTVLVMLIVPGGLALTFWCLLQPSRSSDNQTEYRALAQSEHEVDLNLQSPESSALCFVEKITIIGSLMKYMIPLGAVYFFEYLINQGLFELLYFPRTFLSHSQQYRWYQLTYQLGVLVSRSSLVCLVISRVWLLSLLQGLTAALLCVQAVTWSLSGDSGLVLIFLIVFWEGLLGGAAYVNTFHRISEESEERSREFSLGITSVADSVSIAVAGLVALPLHNIICDMPVIA